MILRDYQIKMLDAARAELRKVKAVLITAPTGSGKGSLISFMVHGATTRGLSVIFGVRGKSLVADMSKRVEDLGVEHGVLMGGVQRQRWHSVQVASVDTWHRMPRPPKADLIIIDECDGAMSDTWLKVIAMYPEAKIVGTTATPIRLDGKPLGRLSGGIFDSMVLGPNENELIAMGYLVPSRVLAPPPPADLGNLKKTAGEFNAAQGAAICDNAQVIGDIVEHWKKHTPGEKTASFGFNQKHAWDIAESFRCAGVNFAYVDADTPLAERARMWKDLATGDLMGVSSVNTITVGWDLPAVSCLVIARKTASLRLHRQMLGRGSRPFSGKTRFQVHDHVGNTHYHAPYGLFEQGPEWELNGEIKLLKDKDKARSVATCKRCFATFARGPQECPYCGKPLLKSEREVEVVAGELQEISNGGVRPASLAEQPAVEEFLRFLRRRREKGRPDNKAPYAYKMVSGRLPSKVIVEAAKRRLQEETHGQ